MFVDPAFGRRIEYNFARQALDYAHQHRALMPEHGAETRLIREGCASGGVAVWGSAFGAPSVSRAFALGLDGDVTDLELTRVEEFYGLHGSRVTLATSPWTSPSLFALLGVRGYRVVAHENVSTRSLSDDAPACRAASPSIHVARLGARLSDVRAWGKVVRVGFGMDPGDPRGIAADRVAESSTATTLFLATNDGEPVGGGAVYLHDGLATLFATSTLPEHRRRGVQGALISARVAYAKEAFAERAIVVTSPGSDSQRNLEAHYGFRVAYTATVFESP